MHVIELKYGEECANLLSREEQLHLASTWIVARKKGSWHFICFPTSNRDFVQPYRQVEPPSLESNICEGQEAATFIEN
jgi:hypothetical protein